MIILSGFLELQKEAAFMNVLGFCPMNIGYVYSVEHVPAPGETIPSGGDE